MGNYLFGLPAKGLSGKN